MSTDPNKIIYSMIRVSKFYNKKPIIKDISLSYFYGAKIGVLGLNGSGKSTLLKIMAGVDKEFNGETILSKGYSIGYLEQEPLVDETKTVREIVQQGVQETVDLVNEFNQINERFAEPMSDDEMDHLIQRQGEVQEQAGRPGCLGPGLPAGNGHGCPALPSRRHAGECHLRRRTDVGWPFAACC